MTQSWRRMDAAGNVVGLSESDRATAEMNLGFGQYLLPVVPGGHHHHPLPDRPEDDPAFMRRTGYPTIPDQVGVLMKIAAAVLAGEPVAAEVRAEFAAISADIEAVKSDHPKPKTPPA